MDLQLEPELYAPNIDNTGVFVDHIPYIGAGIRCPCCSRKDKVYTTRAQFASHIKTKAHVKWLQQVNDNKANLFIENVRLQDLVKQQQQIIAKLENDLQNKLLTIDYLTKMLTQQNQKTVDLLDLN